MPIAFDNAEGKESESTGTQTLSNFTLGDASGNDRMVIVCLSMDSTVEPVFSSIKFDGTNMTKIVSRYGSIVDIYDCIWVILDADLPATAGDYDVVATYSTSPIAQSGTLDLHMKPTYLQ